MPVDTARCLLSWVFFQNKLEERERYIVDNEREREQAISNEEEEYAH